MGTLSLAGRGQTVMIEICFNAVETYMPPMIIQCNKSYWIEPLRERCIMQFSELDDHWNIFGLVPAVRQIFRCFNYYPVLLLVDRHVWQNIELIERTHNNGITMLCFSPHWSPRLQSLDLGCKKPLGIYYDQAASNCLRSHPGRTKKLFK